MIIDLSAPLPKEAEAYLAFVRALPSAASGQYGCRSHHQIRGRFSQHKVSDFLTMPLTEPEHLLLHSDYRAFVRQHGITEGGMIAKTMTEALRLGVFTFDPRRARMLAGSTIETGFDHG